ncbi:MAG: type II secretory pathway pseudopilin PulG [Planctomycetota bacterium]|jgi:type II secretory pathway pseudopilin PulG
MRQSLGLYQRGFSVLELVLTLTLLLAVAAVCLPGPLPDPVSKEDKAAILYCRAIAFALDEYRADTGFSPIGREGKRTCSWLRGPGVDPQFNEHPGKHPTELFWFVTANKMGGGDKWSGPYMSELEPDPWGRRYVVLIAQPKEENDPVRNWILSAGPDGMIDTSLTDSVPSGDDLGVLMD